MNPLVWLAGFFDQRNRLLFVRHDLAGDDALPDLLLAGQRVHQVEHQVLDDHPQDARADLARQGELRDRLERVVRELELHVLVLEQLLVLTRNRVPRLRENLDQGRAVELVERADDGEAADEFGNQAVLDEIFRLHLFERGADLALRQRLDVGLEAERLLAGAALDLLVEADEGAAADEEDVARVDLEELLVRVLAAALRRDIGDRAFEDLQERLLDAFPRHVARDRGILVLAADLVDLVDVDDALLALLDVAAGRLQQLQDDVLDVLADVAGFRQRRRVDDGEGDGEELGERLREERLAGAGRADQQDVRLRQLDVVPAARLLLDLDPLVVVVDRDRQLLLGLFLPDDVFVQELLDLLGNGEGGPGAAARLEPVVVRDDVVAHLDALVADEHRRARDELADVVLILVTERAAKDFRLAVLLDHGRAHAPAAPGQLRGRTSERLGALADDIIDNTVFLPLVRGHDVVAFRVVLDALGRLPGVLHEDLVDPLAHPQDFLRGQVDVGGLPAESRHPGLVDQDAGIGEGVPLAFGARRQQHGGNRR